MNTEIPGRAIYKGHPIVSVDPAPFDSLDSIRWRLPTREVFTTAQLRMMSGRSSLEIVYAPRRCSSYAALQSSLGDLAGDDR